MDEFINTIIATLEKNGFPNKRVALPVEKMYEAADNRGLNFNQVLEIMKEDYSIEADIEVERVIFSKAQEQAAPDFSNIDPSMFEGMDKGNMFQKAQEMMSKMSPEQLQKIQEQVANMDPKQREDLMKKAKSMGLA